MRARQGPRLAPLWGRGDPRPTFPAGGLRLGGAGEVRLHVLRIGDVDEVPLMRERDGLGTAVHAQLAEDALDVRRDRLRADEELARDVELPRAAREESEHLLLAWRELQVCGARHVFRSPDRTRSSQHRADAGEQLVGIKRLDDVVVGADQETATRLKAPAARPRRRSRRSELVPQLPADRISTHAGQVDLEHDQPRRIGPRGRERVLTRLEPMCLVAGVVEEVEEERAGDSVAVDDEHRAVDGRHPETLARSRYSTLPLRRRSRRTAASPASPNFSTTT